MSASFPNPPPPPRHNDSYSNAPSSSSSSPPSRPTDAQTIARECRQCLSFLARALDQPGRPRTLLKALGVAPHGPAIHDDDGTRTLYKPTPDGRGIALQLSHAPPPTTSQDAAVSHVSLHPKLSRAASRINPHDNTPVLTTSPALESRNSSPLENAGGAPTTVTIECQTCGFDTRAEAGARAYVRGPAPLSIVLCSNRLSTQREVDEVLVHELIHIYDIFSQNMDLRTCPSLAYSEVRAARDAECRASLTAFTRNICAREKATVATENMFPEEGRGCVGRVFDEAIRDVAPLGGEGASGRRRRVDGGTSCLGAGGFRKGSVADESAFRPKEARPSDR